MVFVHNLYLEANRTYVHVILVHGGLLAVSLVDQETLASPFLKIGWLSLLEFWDSYFLFW